MIRTVQLSEITENIKEMCIEANHFLSPDMAEAMKQAQQNEKSPLGKQILGQLQENLEIAAQDRIPICQDTGMAVVFLEIGQDVHFEGGSLEEAVNEGVRQGYVEGYLRKSVVGDPLIRENTKDNTPAVLHIRIVEGDRVKIKVAPKGFGSENMSRVFMLKPAEGIEVSFKLLDASYEHINRKIILQAEELLGIHTDHSFIQKVMECHTEAKTAEELAELCGANSTVTFRRTFLRLFNCPVAQWLRQKRAEQVLKLLRTPTQLWISSSTMLWTLLPPILLYNCIIPSMW